MKFNPALAYGFKKVLCYQPKFRFNDPKKLWTSSQSSSKTDTTTTNVSNGLFGSSTIYNPSDMNKMAFKAIENITYFKNLLVKDYPDDVNSSNINLDNNEGPRLHPLNLTFQHKIRLLDAISNEICLVLDLCELCRNVHFDSTFRKRAEEAFQILSSFLHTINTDDSIYQGVVSLMKEDVIINHCSMEEKLFLSDMKKEFESEGVHLTSKLKELSVHLQGLVVNYESLYMQNTANDDLKIELSYENNQQMENLDQQNGIMDHIQSWRNWIASNYSIEQDNNQNTLTCSSNRQLVGTILKSNNIEQFRKQLWLISHQLPTENMIVLGNMIKSRSQLSTALGYKSYLHKYLESKGSILKTPENVKDFLIKVSTAIKPQANEEIQLLQNLKSSLSKTDHHYDMISEKLQPWDLYYLQAYYKNNYHKNDENNDHLKNISNFFPLHACIEGLSLISHKLFGITLVEEPIESTESWVSDNSSIKKLVVYDSKQNKIGIVYLDLHQRRNKFTGTAHFTIQCGCVNGKYNRNDNNKNSYQIQNSLYNNEQIPIIALVFNFVNNNSIPLLSLYDVETLHHEWGHAIHSLLSKTKFQHFSGTRGSVDFIEVPSHLFEFFARDPYVVSLWAKHWLTNQPIPLELIRNALQKKDDFSGIELQVQLLYALTDQHLFGAELAQQSHLSPLELFHQGCYGIHELQKQYTSLPLLEPNILLSENHPLKHMPYINILDHTHLTNYGGGYYSYLFSKMYAAQIWKHRFAKDPLSRCAGEYLWNNMLRYGSGCDAKEVLENMAGGPLDPIYFLETKIKNKFNNSI
eukprot:gene13215-17714_t